MKIQTSNPIMTIDEQWEELNVGTLENIRGILWTLKQ